MRDGGAEQPLVVTVDPKLKALYQTLLDEMKSARRDEADGFDRYWEAVGTVIEKELWRLAGAKSLLAWIKNVVKESRRTVERNVRVAKYASAAQETRWGNTKLDAAIGFVEAMLGAPIEGRLPVRFEALRIPVVRGRRTLELPLDDVDWTEVAAATKRLLRSKGKGRAVTSPVQDAFTSAIEAVPVLSGNVRPRIHDGRLFLDGGIPLPHLQLLVRAIGGVDWRSIGRGEPAKAARQRTKTKTARPRTKKKPTRRTR